MSSEVDTNDAVSARQELTSLLLRWAAIEAQRCRRRDEDSFEVLYLGCWMAVTADSAGHGPIIAAVLGGCEENRIHCEIDYTPRYEREPANISVGCIPRMFRFDEGDEVIASIFLLLLMEYLERLEDRKQKKELVDDAQKNS